MSEQSVARDDPNSITPGRLYEDPSPWGRTPASRAGAQVVGILIMVFEFAFLYLTWKCRRGLLQTEELVRGLPVE